MALFRNLGVKLRDRLCDVPRYASAQPLVFLDLAENCSFLNWKLTLVPIEFLRFVDGHYLEAVSKPFDDSTIPSTTSNRQEFGKIDVNHNPCDQQSINSINNILLQLFL